MNDSVTLGSIIGIIAVVASAFGIIMNARKIRRETEADARARTEELKAEFKAAQDSIDKRVGKLETTVVDFMPRSEIEAKIEHEKGNRQTADGALQRAAEKLEEGVANLRVDMGRMTERYDSLSGVMGEVKALVKEQHRDTTARIEQLRDLVAHPRGQA